MKICWTYSIVARKHTKLILFRLARYTINMYAYDCDSHMVCSIDWNNSNSKCSKWSLCLIPFLKLFHSRNIARFIYLLHVLRFSMGCVGSSCLIFCSLAKSVDISFAFLEVHIFEFVLKANPINFLAFNVWRGTFLVE